MRTKPSNRKVMGVRWEYICSLELEGTTYYGIGEMFHRDETMETRIPSGYLSPPIRQEYCKLWEVRDFEYLGLSISLASGSYDILERITQKRRRNFTDSMFLDRYYHATLTPEL